MKSVTESNGQSTYSNQKIVVTGGAGLLGKSLRLIKPDYVYLDRNAGDLRDSQAVARIFDREKPDKIIHAAARVGGIRDNVQFPYTYFADNVLINANVVDAAVKRKIPVIAISSTCVFPKESPTYPMTEDFALQGEPEPTNYGYAFSKRLMQIQLETAKQQFGYDFALLFLTNLYGENDDYEHETKAHLVTALLKKMHVAKTTNAETVNLLGTGKPMRQFLHVWDAAQTIIKIVENDVYDVFNVAPD
ncbi:MAG: NAD-dependent epimerase/dehydratase family protein, partial [Pyrinomonadaceae bacterium]|nr:NAD-dependent epimerase/dehydratase family protein [Pyrinomonadaceae bacterium]